jgi:polyferredoxin
LEKKQKIDKNKEKPIQKHRFIIQTIFALICIWIGIEFYFFVEFLESGGSAEYFERPPGAEGFLPISALMSVYYFLLTGIIHPAHPAGFFIFIAIVAVSFVFGKSFCSWICPVGFLSELVGDFGDKMQKKFFKRSFRMPKILDYPLRGLKYLLLAFFVYAIFFTMTEAALKYFLDSPYNIISDVKMYYFFADISRTSLIVISVLFILSIFIRNFWCRYLCPYGALLGVLGFLSPTKIKREKEKCIDCSLCTKACPSMINVEKASVILSDECTSCLNCVDACPVEDTLYIKSYITKKKINKKLVTFGVAAVYVFTISIGILTGNWNSPTTKEEYIKHFESIESIGHPRSTGDIEELNRISKERVNEIRK